MKKIITIMISAVLLAGTVFGESEAVYAAEPGKDVRISDAAVLEQLEASMEKLTGQEKKPAAGWKEKGIADSGEKSGAVRMKAAKTCGSKLTWSLSGGTLTISGQGAMWDYDGSSNCPGWDDQKEEITEVVIQSGVTSIGECAFYECDSLRSVSIPDTVSSIGRIAFAECRSLEQVKIPSKVKTLSYGVFADCWNLTQVTCSGATSIEDYAFQNVPLQSFTVPKNMKMISGLAFFDADVQMYQVASGNKVFSAQNGVLYTDGGKTLFAYPAGNPADSFTVPARVTKIGEAAMSHTDHLKSVSFAGPVKELASSAFQNAGLTSIAIPNSVTTAGDFTFYGCPDLVSVTFGSGLKATSYEMFENCGKLKTIHFGKVLQKLEALTFAYCPSLSSVSLPASVKEIGNGVFGECSALTSFKSNGLKNVPFQAFMNCENLKTVTLNSGVTDIYRAAFYGCSALKNVTLPKSVKYVHSIAFPKSTKIKCKNSNMQKFGVNGYRYLEKVSITGTRDYKKAYEVLNLVNQKRAKAGLGKLTMHAGLLESAMNRAAECAVCFSHTRPDGSICFDVNAAMCAENIAAGQSTAKSVMSSWMNSPGHKANILLDDANCIGIGCFVHNGVTYWTQCFGTEKGSSCKRPANRRKTQAISLAAEKFDEAQTGVGVSFSMGDTEYSYKYKLSLSKSSIKMKGTSRAKLMVQNAGFSSVYALLNHSAVTWKTSSKSVAKVDKSGKITGVRKGTVTITAKLKYHSASRKVKVDYDSKTLKKVKAVQKKLPRGTVYKLKKQKNRTLKITCKAVKGVNGYQVRIAANKKMKNAKNYEVKKRQTTIQDLKKGKRYYVQVRVYRNVSGMKVYGKWGTAKSIKL